jgi:hypothetical protein
MLEDSCFLIGVSSCCLCCLHFKVYPLAWYFKGNRPVKLYVGCLFPIYVNHCVVMFTKVLICLKPFDNTKKSPFACAFTHFMHHMHSLVTKNFPCAHYLLVLLPQSERWLVLAKFTNQLEFIKQDYTREGTWLISKKKMLSSAPNWLL